MHDIEATDKNNATPVHQAAWRNIIKTAKLLPEHGAEIEARNVNKITPLHEAAWTNSTENCKTFNGPRCKN